MQKPLALILCLSTVAFANEQIDVVSTGKLPSFCEIQLQGPQLSFDNFFMNAKIAMVQPGHGAELPALEKSLRDQGVDLIFVKDPTAADVAALRPEQGYFYGPLLVTWHQPVRSYEERIDAREDYDDKKKKEKKKQWARKLKATEQGFSVSELPMNAENWATYYEKLHLPHMVQDKVNGADLAGREFATKMGAAVERFSILLIRAEAGDLAGGAILERIPAQKLIKVKFAAFNKKAYGDRHLASRVFAEMVQIAKKEGLTTLSYGSDPNFYGNALADPGLQNFKSSLGYEPQFWAAGGGLFGATRIIKVLNREKMGKPYFMTFSFSGPDKGGTLQFNVVGTMPENEVISYQFPRGLQLNRFP